MEELEIIKELADGLLCETHPSVCALRDKDFDSLAEQVLVLIDMGDAETVQQAFAIIEMNAE